MKKFGVIVNNEKDKDLHYTRVLVQSIISRGAQANIKEDIANIIGIGNGFPDEDSVLENSEIVICLGGDGTFLKVARSVYKRNLPMFGINLGTLGFLTEVDKDKIDTAISQIMEGEYRIEERMMLETRIFCDGKVIEMEASLNEVVISRGALSRILHLDTYVNDMFLDTFPGDGLIIATPTGSTAYSLSAGGPIAEPDINVMIITPICPHNLYSRSFITNCNSTIKIEVGEDYYHGAMVAVDGQKGYEIKGGDIVEIKKAQSVVKIVRIGNKSLFNILRTKIYNRGESKER